MINRNIPALNLTTATIFIFCYEAPEFSEESNEDLLAEMDRFDTILLGANTYKMFVDFWPETHSSEQIVADKLNSFPKIVFSNTLKMLHGANGRLLL